MLKLFRQCTIVHICCLLFPLCCLAEGRNYYVDINNPGCNDAGDSSLSEFGSETTPLCSINKAFLVLEAGDTAIINPGTYSVSDYETTGFHSSFPAVTAQNSGTELAPIKVIGNTTARNIIGKGNDVNDDTRQAFITNGFLTVKDGKNYWEISGLYFKDDGGLYVERNTGFKVSDSLFKVDPRPTLRVYDFKGGHSLIMNNVKDVEMRHLEVWSVNLNKGRPFSGETGLETRAGLIGIGFDSENISLLDSYVYSGRNNLQAFRYSGTPGPVNCTIQNNLVANGQEHLGNFCNNNFIFRRNTLVESGQQGPYMVIDCDEPKLTAIVENNTLIGVKSGIDLNCNDDHFYNGIDQVTFKNNAVINSTGDFCFYFSPFVNTITSDYNFCLSRDREDHSIIKGKFAGWAGYHYSDLRDWLAEIAPGWPYSLAEWQAQTDIPQTLQDPNSIANVDPGFITPFAVLGQFDNNVPCGEYLGEEYSELVSNCKPPFRMKLLDDIHLRADSVLRDAGDPLYGDHYPGERVDIGAKEFGIADDEIPPPAPPATPPPADDGEIDNPDQGDSLPRGRTRPPKPIITVNGKKASIEMQSYAGDVQYKIIIKKKAGKKRTKKTRESLTQMRFSCGKYRARYRVLAREKIAGKLKTIKSRLSKKAKFRVCGKERAKL